MNRETEAYYSELPQTQAKRSAFMKEKSHKTTFMTGDIVPIFVDPDILPGSTVEMDMAEVVRGATPIFPVMDNAYLDIYFFFTPYRLVWEHWKAFWGENEVTYWEQPTEYEVPQIEAPTGGWTEGTLADYFGLPTKVGNISVNALPGRCYCKIFNDWFRDENLEQPAFFNTDETTITGVNTGDPVTDAQKLGKPLKAAKAHDFWTSMLPEPQKGPSVQIPLGTTAPVILGPNHTFTDIATYGGLQWKRGDGNPLTGDYEYGLENGHSAIDGTGTTAGKYNKVVYPQNLWADLKDATGATIGALRMAWAIQEFYERQASGGSRYIEFLANIFAVQSSDARMQRSEYLGGTRIPINVDQVLQTSSTDAVSPQGNTGAFSCTISSDSIFTKSFEEHGCLMGLAVIRTEHTYQQGIPVGFTRKKWTDFYLPQFAELSEMGVPNKCIYAQGDTVVDSDGNIIDDQIFGYQEAWADYRYATNMVSGLMRSNATGTLDSWHYADKYTSLPTLSSTWIRETENNVKRTMAVQTQPQWIGDFFFKWKYVAPMPIYSRPFGMQYM